MEMRETSHMEFLDEIHTYTCKSNCYVYVYVYTYQFIMAERDRCESLTQKGEQCKNPAIEGSRFCQIHRGSQGAQRQQSIEDTEPQGAIFEPRLSTSQPTTTLW